MKQTKEVKQYYFSEIERLRKKSGYADYLVYFAAVTTNGKPKIKRLTDTSARNSIWTKRYLRYIANIHAPAIVH